MNSNHVFVAFGTTFLVLGVLLALGGGCTCSAPNVHWNIHDWGTPSVNAVELPHKATLRLASAEKPARLALSLDSASIEVEGDASVTGIDATFEVREKSPGDVSLFATTDGVEAKSASGSPLLVVSAKVRVPKTLPVKIATSLGAVSVAGIEGVDEVSATSDSGRVDLRDLRNVERVVGKTSLGEVRLSDATGVGDVTLEADAGAVRLARLADGKRAKLKTSLGEIRVETLVSSESLSCETDSGSVRVSEVTTGACRLKSDLGEVRAERSTFDQLYAHTSLGGVRLTGCTYKSKDVGTDLGSVDETK
jgi:DUF4097 and DUF4098 domain-containing protein YvlB